MPIPKTKFEVLKATVLEHYNLKEVDLLSPRRTRDVARPRQVLMYLAYHKANMSYPAIGRRLERDHTTVIHADRAVENLRQKDPDFEFDFQTLQEKATANLAGALQTGAQRPAVENNQYELFPAPTA